MQKNHQYRIRQAKQRFAIFVFTLTILGVFVLILLASSSYKDSAYRARARLLAQKPECHVVLGSSRVFGGVHTQDVLTTSARNQPLLFNFGFHAAGPVNELIYFRRLVKSGIRMKGVCIELWPPLLSQLNIDNELKELEPRLSIDEAHLLSRVVGRPNDRNYEWNYLLRGKAFTGRTLFLYQIAPGWIPPAHRPKTYTDDYGWTELPLAREPKAHERNKLEVQSREKLIARVRDWQLSPVCLRALQELIRQSKEYGHRPTLLLMPEAPVCTQWYSKESLLRFDKFVEQLALENDVPVLDYRAGLQDSDFADGQHLLYSVSQDFTRSLAESLSQSDQLKAGLHRRTIASDSRPSKHP